MDYQVELSCFHGPLDVLLHLIKKNEMDIYDIPIREITTQYLAYLEQMNKIDLDVSSDFVVMAAQLLAIKAKMMLPEIKLEEEEEIDPRNELVDRLLLYKQFKQVADWLSEQAQTQAGVHFRKNTPEMYLSLDEEHLQANIDAGLLMRAFERILAKKKSIQEQEQKIEPLLVRNLDIKQEIQRFCQRFSLQKEMSFHGFFYSLADKFQMIGQFLALLELVRAGKIRLQTQEEDLLLLWTDQ